MRMEYAMINADVLLAYLTHTMAFQDFSVKLNPVPFGIWCWLTVFRFGSLANVLRWCWRTRFNHRIQTNNGGVQVPCTTRRRGNGEDENRAREREKKNRKKNKTELNYRSKEEPGNTLRFEWFSARFTSISLHHAMALTHHSVPSLFNCFWQTHTRMLWKLNENEKSTCAMCPSACDLFSVSLVPHMNETKFFIRSNNVPAHTSFSVCLCRCILMTDRGFRFKRSLTVASQT